MVAVGEGYACRRNTVGRRSITIGGEVRHFWIVRMVICCESSVRSAARHNLVSDAQHAIRLSSIC